MREDEVYKLLSKVRIYYQNMSKSDDVNDLWFEVLKNYDTSDVIEGLDRYLDDEKNRARIPIPQDLIVGLKTIDQKEKLKNDILIDCNLCHKTMRLSEYNNTHFKKCLLIKTLIPILQKKGNDVTYEVLNEYDYTTLDKLYEKYGSLKTIEDMKEIKRI